MGYEFARALCALAALAFFAIGALALLAPQTLARTYGVAASGSEALAFVRATGARDLVLGALFAAAAYANDVRALVCLSFAGVAVSLADFAIAARYARGFRGSVIIHLSGAAIFLAIASMLLRSL